jgi:hypothetical protein
MHIVTILSDSRRGFGLKIGFINQFTTGLVIPLKYSAITDFHTLQIITAHANCFQSAVVSTSRSLVTASSSGDSSTTPTKFSLHRFPYNCQLATQSVTNDSTSCSGCPPYNISAPTPQKTPLFCCCSIIAY